MLWLPLLAAAAPLVHDTADPGAPTRARDAGLQGELTPASLQAVRAADAWSQNGQPLRACTPGEVDAGAVRGHLLYGELEEAQERLATERLRCGGPAEKRAELERAAGLLALSQGDDAAAAEHFAVAKGYDPQLPWDDGFPADQRPLFDEAEPAVANLQVYPPVEMLDGGAPQEGPIAAGAHGFTVGAFDLNVQHGRIDDVVAVPGAYPPELPALADEEARRQLTHVLSAAFGPGERVHIAAPDALWTGTTGRVDWTSRPWPEPVEAPPSSTTKKRSKAPWYLAGAGAAVLVGGGVLTGASLAQANGIASDMGTASVRADYDALGTDLDAANGRMRIGQGILAGGAGIAAVGLTWGVVR